MNMIYQTRLVRIGNSQGVRLPKFLVEQAGLNEDVELEVGEHQLIMRSVRRPRADWDAQFSQMAENSDDQLLDEAPSTSRFDADEWEW
jgi:antitoxin MazE